MPTINPNGGNLLQHLKDTNSFDSELEGVIDYIERVVDLVDRTNSSLNPIVTFTYSTSGTINSSFDASNEASTTY